MVKVKALSWAKAQQAADSELTFTHLLLSVQRNGRDGLVILMTDDSSGTVRVTKTTRILDAAYEFLAQAPQQQLPPCGQ